MARLPADFAELLTREGRRVLDGEDARRTGALSRGGTRFLALPELIEPAAARRCLAVIERAFEGTLRPLEQPIPPEATWGMSCNYGERLPKTARARTAMLQSRRSRSYRVAVETGLLALLQSDSLRRLAEVLNGRPLRRRSGAQLLCYGPGDYAGPHNDHHPEDERARDGYLDVHLTLCNAEVQRQLLVYERAGHFSAVADVGVPALLTAYRLPFWHFTTPLEGSPGARRWVLLGTFLDAPRPR